MSETLHPVPQLTGFLALLSSSSWALGNSCSNELPSSLNRPTSSQFFRKRVGVGVWSGVESEKQRDLIVSSCKTASRTTQTQTHGEAGARAGVISRPEICLRFVVMTLGEFLVVHYVITFLFSSQGFNVTKTARLKMFPLK